MGRFWDTISAAADVAAVVGEVHFRGRSVDTFFFFQLWADNGNGARRAS